jgi:predicted Zn-dependent protease
VSQVRNAQLVGFGVGLVDMLFGGRGTAGAIGSLGAQMVGQGVFMKYSRDAERDADRQGVLIMRRAGMNPRGMLTFLGRLAQLQRSDPGKVGAFFSSHPSLQERQRNVRGLLQS